VRYRIEISEKAREQLRALPKKIRRNIGQRMEAMCDDLRGDVLKLRDKGNRYRLRIGTFRVLFVLAGDVIQVDAFAVYGGHGTTASSTIVYEIEPGKRLGWHTDAAEER
jgi:mRNA-degrading endonuclease RelE of RelBE toxin-antitoxin system